MYVSISHSLAPWRISEISGGDDSGMVDKPAQIGNDDTCIAEVCGGIGYAEQYANARLIAAAPTMLEVLLECREMLYSMGAQGINGEMPDPLWERLNEVLVKAGCEVDS